MDLPHPLAQHSPKSVGPSDTHTGEARGGAGLGGRAQSPTLGGAGRTVVGGGGTPWERPHGWLSRLFGAQVDENTVLFGRAAQTRRQPPRRKLSPRFKRALTDAALDFQEAKW